MAEVDVEVRQSGGIPYASLPDLKKLVAAMKTEGNQHIHVDVMMEILNKLEK